MTVSMRMMMLMISMRISLTVMILMMMRRRTMMIVGDVRFLLRSVTRSGIWIFLVVR